MSTLLEPAFLKRLEKLQLISRRLQISRAAPGERKSQSRGRSVEFAEHREYFPGDDIRHIDWNAFARTDQLFMKLFTEEREMTLTLLIDVSTSMADKSLFARQLAAALGYVALAGYDRVAVGYLSDRLLDYRAPMRGKGRIFQLLKFLEEAPQDGLTNLDQALKNFAIRYPKPGLVTVVSDFFQPGAGLEGIKYLRYRKNQVQLIQVCTPEEENPELRGDLKLVDVETEWSKEVTLTPTVLAAYRKAFADHQQLLRDWCLRNDCGFLYSNLAVGVEDLVLSILRKSGYLR